MIHMKTPNARVVVIGGGVVGVKASSTIWPWKGLDRRRCCWSAGELERCDRPWHAGGAAALFKHGSYNGSGQLTKYSVDLYKRLAGRGRSRDR